MGNMGPGEEAHKSNAAVAVSPARLRRLPVPQSSAMQIRACTQLPACNPGQLGLSEAAEEGWGRPARPTPFIIFTVNEPLWLLFRVHPSLNTA